MMRRTKYRLLLMTALLHLIADVAFAGGAVLCVGANDHLAVEMQHGASGDCQAENLAAEATLAETYVSEVYADSSSKDCTDRPLHGEAEFVSGSREETSELIQDSAVALDAVFGIDLASASSFDCHGSVRSLSPHLPAHRTTVLLI